MGRKICNINSTTRNSIRAPSQYNWGLIASVAINIILASLLLYPELKSETDSPVNPNKPFSGVPLHKTTQHEWKKDELFASLPVDSNSIILTGDSFIANFHIAEIQNDLNYRNRGINGEFSAGVVEMIPMFAQHHPEKIVVLVGINDILRDIPHSTILKNFRKMIQIVHDYSPKTKLYIISILPKFEKDGFCSYCNDEIKALNSKLRSLCQHSEAIFIDIHDQFLDHRKKELRHDLTLDGLHPNAKGYELLHKLLIKALL